MNPVLATLLWLGLWALGAVVGGFSLMAAIQAGNSNKKTEKTLWTIGFFVGVAIVIGGFTIGLIWGL